MPTELEIEKAIESFQGDISQIPPMYSAKKVAGKKLYDLARKGLSVERTPINIHVKIELISYKYPTLEIKVTCSKGTYIRTLADDIGKKLTCGGYLSALCRTRVGPYHLDNALEQENLNQTPLADHLII